MKTPKNKKYLVLLNLTGEYISYSEERGFGVTSDINDAHRFGFVEHYAVKPEIFTVVDEEDFEEFSRLPENELLD
jgi:hypothetical protein